MPNDANSWQERYKAMTLGCLVLQEITRRASSGLFSGAEIKAHILAEEARILDTLQKAGF